MFMLSRRASLFALIVAGMLCTLPLARAKEGVRCERCEHRYVKSAHELKASPRAKQCRVCRVQRADGMRAGYEFARTAAERRQQLVAWGVHRAGLLPEGYEIGEITGVGAPVLKPLATRAALNQALQDEALRFKRIAAWSRDMADRYEGRRGTAMRAYGKDDTWGRWAYADLIRAFKERVALHTAVSKRYAALVLDPASAAFSDVLPKVERPERPEGKLTGGAATRVAVEIQGALRNLLVMERDALTRLLAVTSGAKDAKPLDTADLKFLQELASPGLSTSIVSTLYSRSTGEVEAMTLLRLRLNEDGPLAGFFQRAPVIAAALRREASTQAPK